MAATTTPSISSLVASLRAAYPAIRLQPDTPCRWSPPDMTVYYDPADTPESQAVLLHEMGHALLDHADFSRDIELLAMERAAWQHATTVLAPALGVAIDQDLIQTHLDSYRDWLHERSACPRCQQTGLQSKRKTYSCLNCRSSWRVNDARQCGLKRVLT